MQSAISLSTSLLFVVHVVLGCCAHHVQCQEHENGHRRYLGQAASNALATPHQTARDCHRNCHSHHSDADEIVVAGHGDSDGSPEHGNHRDTPDSPCKESSCTYVKVEVARVDLGESCQSWSWIWAMRGGPLAVISHSAAVADSPANPSDEPFYLRHCALLI